MVSGHDPFEPLHSALCRVAEELDRRWPHPPPPKKTPPATASHRGRHGLDRNGPLKGLLGGIFQKKAETGAAGATGEDTSCANCLHFAVTWSFLVNGFLQAIPCQIISIKKRFHKQHDDNGRSSGSGLTFPPKKIESLRRNGKKSESLPAELLLVFVFDHLLRGIPKLDRENVGSESKLAAKDAQFDHFGTITGFFKGRKADVDGFLTNLGFARMGGVPSSMVEVAAAEKADDGRGGATVEVREEHETNVGHKLASGLLQIPLSNVERLKSTLTTVSLPELIDLVPQLGRSSTKEYPDKKKLFSVQDFFRYTETEGGLPLDSYDVINFE